MYQILCSSFSDKLVDAAIVVVMGVVIVFLILALLIGVISLIKYVNKYMDKFDEEKLARKQRRIQKKQAQTLDVSNESVAVEVVGDNLALVAVITGAIQMMLEQEGEEKFVKFRVRSIKEIK